ncbi:MAG TPA: hypothetical protein DCP92_25195 [Nitrospiraceae bacterium]|jgi:CHASE3 domain sensor protein|nr:hypothetical protein [Nitrospiraceae bacterium]
MMLQKIATQLWQRLPLNLHGKIQVAIPLFAIGVSAALALSGNYRHVQIEAPIQRQVQTVAVLDKVLTLMVNAETGMRGYLLTRREEFLEPYAAAQQNLPATMSYIRSLIDTEKSNNTRTNKLDPASQLQVLINRQMSNLAWQRRYVTMSDTSADEIFNHLAFGKHLMDEIRDNIGHMRETGWRLLAGRIQEINDIRRRDYLAVFLTLVVGLGSRLVAWRLFNTEVIRRVEHLVKNTRCLLHGKPLPFPPSGKPDALGDLEQEIALMNK